MKFNFVRRCLALMLLASTTCAAPTPQDYAPRAVDMPKPYVTLENPTWSQSAVVYEVNVRQFTKEGTFSAAEKQLPRLRRLGVGILWLMPIHPIGEDHRLGPLGSPYAVRDYFGVNPEFGNMKDLKRFVRAAHENGMHVILDWVANHSARDNPLTVQHPDWYEKNGSGQLRAPLWVDWTDVLEFNYDNPQLRRYMTEALKFWVREAGVDGFRADFAGGVPLQFWENARSELEQIKPIFMLAEWESPDLNRRAFDASYAWKLTQAMRDIAAGHANNSAIVDYFNLQTNSWPHEAYKLAFTSNHDVSQSGSDRELFGAALQAMVALTFAADTMPMIYNGEEIGNEKRLNFLTREAIVWHAAPEEAFYTKLIKWKKANLALHNGQYGGAMIPVKNNSPNEIFSFVRTKDGNKVLAVFNLSKSPQRAVLSDAIASGRYVDFSDSNSVDVSSRTIFQMPPWSFRLMTSDGKPH